MTGNLVAIHFDRADKDHIGMRVFVTDGPRQEVLTGRSG